MSGISAPSIYNVDSWIEENKKFFLPPVCNKMMHTEGQMKLFFVGGPNQRKDYHMESGEELFLQIKGDMVLKIVERGKHRDIKIKEGEMFLLPGRIPHSPQRQENTVGLVMERERHEDTEKDGLRYYIEENGEKTLDVLYEQWFYCIDLGSQIAPVIKSFFASEQYKTGKPIPGTIPEICPLDLDTQREVEEPFCFQQWVDEHREEIQKKGKVPVFDLSKYQFQVFMFGEGQSEEYCEHAESWVWQWEGSSTVTFDDVEYNLKKRDSLLIPPKKRFSVNQEKGSTALVCYQDPTKSTTWPEQ